MKEKIIEQINTLEKEYSRGNYSSTEYHELLNELNEIAFMLEKWDLCDIISCEIQELIHKKQSAITD